MADLPGGAVVCLATKGAGSNEEQRIVDLLDERLGATLWPLERRSKVRSAVGLLRMGIRSRPRLIVAEGTGVGVGLVLILLRLLRGTPYVISSGDAVGPFIASHHPPFGPAAGAYERLLCRLSAGYIGWTPYLAGRALTFGAPRVVTAAGYAPFPAQGDERDAMRERLCIPAGNIVFGLVGALNWNPHRGYCYGLELVQAATRTNRRDLTILVAGGGDGLDRLREHATGARAHLVITGAIPQSEVPAYLAAMDVASLPQSVDGVGSFRYTTKLSEYLAAGVPVVTGQIPLAYDLDEGWLWRLPGDSPWDETYVAALAALMDDISAAEIADRRAMVPRDHPVFDLDAQRRRVSAFVEDLLERDARRRL